jgi:putative transposase
MAQGKMERYHRSMKNRWLWEHYYLPQELEQRIENGCSMLNISAIQNPGITVSRLKVYNYQRVEKLKQQEIGKQHSSTQQRKNDRVNVYQIFKPVPAIFLSVVHFKLMTNIKHK